MTRKLRDEDKVKLISLYLSYNNDWKRYEISRIAYSREPDPSVKEEAAWLEDKIRWSKKDPMEIVVPPDSFGEKEEVDHEEFELLAKKLPEIKRLVTAANECIKEGNAVPPSDMQFYPDTGLNPQCRGSIRMQWPSEVVNYKNFGIHADVIIDNKKKAIVTLSDASPTRMDYLRVYDDKIHYGYQTGDSEDRYGGEKGFEFPVGNMHVNVSEALLKGDMEAVGRVLNKSSPDGAYARGIKAALNRQEGLTFGTMVKQLAPLYEEMQRFGHIRTKA